MANPSNLKVRSVARPQDELDQLRLEYNKLVTQLRVLTAKLDADAGVTDTNYAALVTAADSTSPALVDLVM